MRSMCLNGQTPMAGEECLSGFEFESEGPLKLEALDYERAENLVPEFECSSCLDTQRVQGLKQGST